MSTENETNPKRLASVVVNPNVKHKPDSYRPNYEQQGQKGAPKPVQKPKPQQQPSSAPSATKTRPVASTAAAPAYTSEKVTSHEKAVSHDPKNVPTQDNSSSSKKSAHSEDETATHQNGDNTNQDADETPSNSDSRSDGEEEEEKSDETMEDDTEATNQTEEDAVHDEEKKSKKKKNSGEKDSKKHKKSSTKSSHAGLTFPVGRIRSRLKKGFYAKRIGDGAAVYLAAVMEYLTQEILSISQEVAKDNRVKRITPRHINMAMREDTELWQCLTGNNASILGGGVVSNDATLIKAEENYKYLLQKERIRLRKEERASK
jgi:histone H2A